jgi:hypothetical protein
MKTWSKIFLWLGILSLLLGAAAWAQIGGSGTGTEPGRGHGGAAMRSGRGPGMRYNPQNVETVSGVVTEVRQATRRSRGLHLMFKTDKETLIVILGPASYLEQQKMKIAAGDKLEIKGSRIKRPQQAVLIAGEVKKGDQVVKLRDEQGMPLWPRQGPGR